MDKYELVVIVDAATAQDEKEAVIKETHDAIEKSKGKVINSHVWLEKHKFSFRMKKRAEGTYYIVNFEGEKASLVELRKNLKLNEKILRSLIVK